MRLASKKLFPSKLFIFLVMAFAVIESMMVFHFQIMLDVETPESLRSLSFAIVIFGLVLVLVDLLLGFRQHSVVVERRVAGSMAVNRWSQVELRIQHHFRLPQKIKLFDGIPDEVNFDALPLTINLLPGKFSRHRYRIKPKHRGPLIFSKCFVRSSSPIGFWTVSYNLDLQSKVKVYPDFSVISAYTILATDNHASQIGIKRKPRRGEGLEFLQLREYRRGDSLRQIDWNATSRRQKLISREYQDERDQHIVLLIDSGRRMRAIDDTLSHFDHSLNALLLVSHIALKQGDSVSALSFGKEQRWVPPQKGAGNVKTILNAMYDLQAENCAPDYVSAAERLAGLQRKRSLIILVTNTRDEEIDELMLAVKVLRKNHVVLLANVREKILDSLLQIDIRSFDDALVFSGANHYMHSRNEAQQILRNNGVFLVDCLPDELAVKVANSYLEIKSAGVL